MTTLRITRRAGTVTLVRVRLADPAVVDQQLRQLRPAALLRAAAALVGLLAAAAAFTMLVVLAVR